MKGILSLRWPDQEKIRAYFPGEAAEGGGAEEEAAQEDEGSPDAVSFSSEYAKSGRAKVWALARSLFFLFGFDDSDDVV